jgi:hypothetical protein
MSKMSKMSILKKTLIAVSVVMITGCASGLNSIQEREYSAFERDGVLIEEKKPSTGVVLGLLPGGGSFYVREPGLGVVNLLLWPLSILWDPISGSDGAKAINYDLTKYQLKREKNKELSSLDDKLSLNQIDQQEYILKKREIDQKYDYE